MTIRSVQKRRLNYECTKCGHLKEKCVKGVCSSCSENKGGD